MTRFGWCSGLFGAVALVVFASSCQSEGVAFGDDDEEGGDGGTSGTSGGAGAGSGRAGNGGVGGDSVSGSNAGGASGSGGDAGTPGTDAGAPGEDGGMGGDGGTSAGSGGMTAGTGGTGGMSAGTGGMNAGTGGGGMPGNIAPVPGKGGALAATAVTLPRTTLSWTAATDDSTPVAQLRYRVYRSLQNNIGTASNALLNGTAVSNQLTGATQATIALVGGVENFVNVVVWDANDATAAYTALRVAPPTHCEQAVDCASGTCFSYFQDLDGDTYGTDSTLIRRCANQPPAGFVARGGDCCDLATAELADSIHPGQMGYFRDPANICGITYDYNCDGEPTQQYPLQATCTQTSATTCVANLFDGGGRWQGTIPACGGTAAAPVGCGISPPGSPCRFQGGAPSGAFFQACH